MQPLEGLLIGNHGRQQLQNAQRVPRPCQLALAGQRGIDQHRQVVGAGGHVCE